MIRKIACFLIIMTLLAGTGCWDTRNIGDQAFVAAIGLDAPDGDNVRKNPGNPGGFPRQFNVTLEIIKPEALRVRGGGQRASVIRTVTADSLDTAFEKIQTGLPRHISMAHLMVLAVGEKMAGQNFKDIYNYFEKSPEVARRVRLVFVQGGKAADLLKTKPEFNPSMAAELSDAAETGMDLPLTRTAPFSVFIKDLQASNGRALGSRVLTSGKNKSWDRNGGAVFNKWRLAGWLNGEEMRDANWLVGRTVGPVLGDTGKGVYTYLVNNRSVSIKPETKNGQLRFKVKIKTTGSIMQEKGKHIKVEEPKEIKKLEAIFAKVITKQVESAVSKAQKEFRVDYLGFGTILKRHEPEIAKKLDWDKTFPDVPVDVEVNSTVNLIALSR